MVKEGERVDWRVGYQEPAALRRILKPELGATARELRGRARA